MNWSSILLEPVRTMLAQIGNFVSSLVLVVLILLVGWIISSSLKNIIIRVLKLLKLDELADRIKVGEFLTKGGIKYTLSELIGIICYWLLILITFVVAINAVGLTVAADLLNRIVLYIPNIIISIFILILGMFVASFLASIVQTASTNAGIGQSKFLGKLVEAVVIIFVIAMALEQLNIGKSVIGLAVNIILASFGLAIALAFGLGCRDIAGKFVADTIEKIRTKK
ncbi:MAG: hypothetical protein PHJ00_04090 [Candidatus Omnitrophica bacterium]|nr:hypothetical protein [Candidatus Omnitrophota bacterium]MDD5655028.1 hypothetical protein [Candidatus Omnitrophota bacterium]